MNVNDVVHARLTKRGAFMVNEQNRELMFRFPGQKLRCDYRRDDLYEQYLWVLMKHFGDQFHLGKEAPFTDVWPIDKDRPSESKTPEPQPWETA